MSGVDRLSRLGRVLLFTVPLLVLLLLVPAAPWLWNEYNPLWDRTAEYQEVNALAASIHQRPLTEAEFRRTLQLCETGNVHARAGAVSIIGESVRQNPEHTPRAIAMLRRVSRASDPELSSYAGGLLNQLTNPSAPAVVGVVTSRPGAAPDALENPRKPLHRAEADVQAQREALDAPPTATARTGSKGWLTAAAVAFGLLFTMALAAVWYERYRRRPGRLPAANGGQEGPTPSAGAAASVAVSCPGCGKRLRARAELAGKKVKCPQCGQGVPIPETNPGSLAPPASTGRFSIRKNRGVVASVVVLAVVAGLCSWHFWPWRDKYAFLNGSLGNQSVAEVQESGFYYQEFDEHGNPFRWTNGKARLVIPIDRRKPPTGLVLKLEIYRPARVKTVCVQIVANDRELIKQQVALGEWQGSSAGRFPAKPLDLTGIDLGDELVLDIISDTFDTKTDARTLGVLVRGIKLLHEAPAPQ